MAVSTLLSPSRLPEAKVATSCHTSGQILVLDPVCQALGMQPILLDRPRQSIGRDSACSIQLPDPGLPSRHAVILRGQRRLVIRAFDRRTWLNQRPVTESSLCEGDLLRVGSFEFRLRGATADELLQNVPSATRAVGFTEQSEAACRLALRQARLATVRIRLKERRLELRREFERLLPEQARLEQRCDRLSTFRIRLKQRADQIRREQESLYADRERFEAERNRAETVRADIPDSVLEAPAAPSAAVAEVEPAQGRSVVRNWDNDADRMKNLFRRPTPPTAEAGAPDDATPVEPQTSPDAARAIEHENIDDSVAEYMKHLLSRSRSARSAAAAGEDPVESAELTSPATEDVDQESRSETAAATAVVVIQELPPEPSLSISSSRRRRTTGEIRAGVGSLREVANLSARTAVASYSLRKLRKSVAVTLPLTIISFALAAILFVMGGAERTYHSQASGALMLGIIVLISLAHSVWKIRILDSGRAQPVSGVARDELPSEPNVAESDAPASLAEVPQG